MTGNQDWPLLGGLDRQGRAELLELARPCSFERGEVVCRVGEPGDSVHLLEEGRLLVQVSLSNGATATLNVLEPGAHIRLRVFERGVGETRSCGTGACAAAYAALAAEHRTGWLHGYRGTLGFVTLVLRRTSG